MLTFTRAATAELAKKLSEHPTTTVERPSTVHSFAISVLAHNPGAAEFPEPIRIADDWESKEIVRRSLAQRSGVGLRVLDRLIKEMAADWESLGSATADPRIDDATRRRFLGAWREHRQVIGYTLLSELAYRLLTALRAHPELDGTQIDLLVVDEYQDLNACDLEVIRQLSDRGVRVVGAGDDDQSIYAWRMADPEGIRRFGRDYENASDYPLSVSQRCGRRIIEWATAVIEADPDRPHRTPLTARDDAPTGQVALLSFSSERAEAVGIARLVSCLTQVEGVPPSEVLILLRGDHNKQFSTPIRQQLAAKNIEVSDPNGAEALFAERDHRFALSVFRLLARRDDSLAWASLLRLTPRIGTAVEDFVYQRARDAGSRFGTTLLSAAQTPNAGPRPSFDRAVDLVRRVTDWLDAHADPELEGDGGWGSWLVSVSGDGFVPILSLKLQELLKALDALTEVTTLERYLAQMMPLAKDYALTNATGVRIMTMSGSKGLTARAAIIAGVEEGIIPRPSASLAEERRLLYVAMTRAREYSFCTWARQRTGPTARAGRPRVGGRRSFSTLLEPGQVRSEDGPTYIAANWPEE